MLPIVHIITGLIFSLILFPFIKFYSIIVFLTIVFIDIDHNLYYIFKYKNFSLKKAYNFFLQDELKDVLNIFHTTEFFILIFVLSFFSKIFFYIFIGMIFHIIFDAIDIIYNKKYGRRAISLIGWLNRHKKDL